MERKKAEQSEGVQRERAQVIPLFLSMAALLVVTVAATYWSHRAAISDSRAILDAQTALDSVQTTLSTMKDAETGQRGFLISGFDDYLDPYNAALHRIDSNLSDLKARAAAGSLESADVDAIRDLVGKKLAEMQHIIDLRRTKGFGAAADGLRAGAGKQLMDDLRERVTAFAQKKHAQIDDLRHAAERAINFSTVVFAVTMVVNVGFLVWALIRVRREIIDREMAAGLALEQKTLLGVTLASIGDAVIVTNEKGKITFLNSAAEQLTGWTSPQAMDQVCTKVFNIVNESTRATVESPVEKVLRLGTVVGLANHTLLIRKDSTEVPIDDSGAPIRDATGAIRGVVLVFRDFSEQKDVERKLLKAKEEAEAANVAKDNFLAVLSHELRTPLTPVLATLTSWETDSAIPGTLLPSVQLLRRNVELEARLIDDLLDLTRIVKGKLPLNFEVVDVHQLLGEVTNMYQSEILAKRLKVTLELAAGEHFIEADSARIQQVFWNIIKNATKFTPEGGQITVRTLNETPGQVQIVFDDTGIGMTSQTLQRIFRPFEQGDDARVRQSGGLGLGMAISKALVEAQSGQIAAASEGEGRGSTFTVSLPAVVAPAQPMAAKPAQSSQTAQRSLGILLVEDHEDTARVMSALLRNRGHQVLVAESVASALELARRENFDVLLSDIGLTDGTGIELIQQLRAERNSAAIPSIALTGFGMEEDVARCREAGFTDHLTKPINFQKLEAAIYRVAVTRI